MVTAGLKGGGQSDHGGCDTSSNPREHLNVVDQEDVIDTLSLSWPLESKVTFGCH